MKIFIVAGDPSGDLHASRLAQTLKELDPKIEISSAAGRYSAAVSRQTLDLTRLAVTGIFEVLAYLPKILKAFDSIIQSIEEIKPDAVVLVDFPDFNLRLAKKLKARGFKILYYISPQVWAWRKNRIELIKKYVDKMLVIFPFEEEFYKKEGVSVSYVGHPLIERIKPKAYWENPVSDLPKTIAFLPGSRKKEVTSHLPLILKTKEILTAQNLKFILIKHPSLSWDLFQGAVKQDIEVIEDKEYSRLAKSFLAVSSSGTATLELALLGIPTIVIYKTGFLSWLILKNLVHVDYISIVNIIAKQKIFPEFIQYDANPSSISRAISKFINDMEAYGKTRQNLGKIRDILGETSASLNAAHEILNAIR